MKKNERDREREIAERIRKREQFQSNTALDKNGEKKTKVYRAARALFFVSWLA